MSTVKRITGDYTIQTLSTGDEVAIHTTLVTLDASDVNILGDLTVTGNATLTGNINADRIFYGTSNVEILTPNSNVDISVGGVSDVAVFATTGAYITGLTSVTGNIIGANVNTAGLITASGNITGANINTAGNLWITRDASAGQPTIRFNDTDTDISDSQVFGAVEWYTSDVSGTPRVTSGIRSVAAGLLGNANVQILTSTSGAAATVKMTVLSTGNVGIANAAPLHTLAVTGTTYISDTLQAAGNITGANITTTGSLTSVGNIQGGNLRTTGLASVTGNITGGNVISVGVISAGVAGISTVGNIDGGNINATSRVSATGNINGDSLNATTGFSTVGNIIVGNANVTIGASMPNIVVSNSMTGTGIGVENIVNQTVDFDLSQATPETIGTLQFDAVANRTYQFRAYVVLVPAGSTTVSPAVSFASGTCLYTTQLQPTSTSAFSTATKTTSDNVTTTYSSTGTDARTLMMSGTFYHTANTTVALRFQTSAANLTVKTGSYLSYTRIA